MTEIYFSLDQIRSLYTLNLNFYRNNNIKFYIIRRRLSRYDTRWKDWTLITKISLGYGSVPSNDCSCLGINQYFVESLGDCGHGPEDLLVQFKAVEK